MNLDLATIERLETLAKAATQGARHVKTPFISSSSIESLEVVIQNPYVPLAYNGMPPPGSRGRAEKYATFDDHICRVSGANHKSEALGNRRTSWEEPRQKARADADFIAQCDPTTILAICKLARMALAVTQGETVK